MTQTPLAAWLRAQLDARHLSQRQLALAAGLATGTISAVMHGRVPKSTLVRKLANYFGAYEATVMELAGLVTLSDLPAEMPVELRDLVRRLYRLDEAERQIILTQVNQLIDLLQRDAGARAGGR